MGDGGANSRIYTVITELETLWNFAHVGFLCEECRQVKSTSIYVSKLNLQPTGLKWNTEIQLQLKISSSIIMFIYLNIYTHMSRNISPLY